FPSILAVARTNLPSARLLGGGPRNKTLAERGASRQPEGTSVSIARIASATFPFTQGLHGPFHSMDFLSQLTFPALTAPSRLAQNPNSAGIQATGAAAATLSNFQNHAAANSGP